jgi:hypothetical protein
MSTSNTKMSELAIANKKHIDIELAILVTEANSWGTVHD